MAGSKERAGKNFSRIKYIWEPDRIGELSASVCYILSHQNQLSKSDLGMVQAAHRFVHDAGLGLKGVKLEEKPKRWLLQAYTIAQAAFDEDELKLRRVLGAGMNVFNYLEGNNPRYQLGAREINRVDEFFGRLAVCLMTSVP